MKTSGLSWCLYFIRTGSETFQRFYQRVSSAIWSVSITAIGWCVLACWLADSRLSNVCIQVCRTHLCVWRMVLFSAVHRWSCGGRICEDSEGLWQRTWLRCVSQSNQQVCPEEAAPQPIYGVLLVWWTGRAVAMETSEGSDDELGRLDIDLDRKSRQHNLTSSNVRAILHVSIRPCCVEARRAHWRAHCARWQPLITAEPLQHAGRG